jgi:transketolase
MTDPRYRVSDVRRLILEQSHRAGVGHIGSALSVADILWALYTRVLRIPASDHPDRDRLILSKGHAALALYAVLCLEGRLSPSQLATYCADGSALGVHPERDTPGVDFSTGSLGHGLGLGVGAALAGRLRGSARRVYVLLSDAECNEGSVWEAVMLAAHHQLANLTAIIDCNGQQALGFTRDVLDLEPLAARWAAFGWATAEVDGHDGAALARKCGELAAETTRPQVLVARTVCGKGVSFMERTVKWHYWPLSDDEFRKAMTEVEMAPGAGGTPCGEGR